MKGFLLAAGNGTRLRPLTNHTPKCLVPIKDKPLIDYWFQLFALYGIDEILINTHHLSDKVLDYVSNVNNGISIQCSYETNLLGSAGTVVANKAFIEDTEYFWVFYGDILIDINLEKMMKYHQDKKSEFTIAVHQTNTPEACGIVQSDNDGAVVSFEEKPKKPLSNLANSGVYLINTSIVNSFPASTPLDFGQDILTNARFKLYSYSFEGYIRDIGTMESYIAANNDLRNEVGYHGNFTDSSKS